MFYQNNAPPLPYASAAGVGGMSGIRQVPGAMWSTARNGLRSHSSAPDTQQMMNAANISGVKSAVTQTGHTNGTISSAAGLGSMYGQKKAWDKWGRPAYNKWRGGGEGESAGDMTSPSMPTSSSGGATTGSGNYDYGSVANPERDRIVERLRAKADSTPFEGEANSFNAKADQLGSKVDMGLGESASTEGGMAGAGGTYNVATGGPLVSGGETIGGASTTAGATASSGSVVAGEAAAASAAGAETSAVVAGGAAAGEAAAAAGGTAAAAEVGGSLALAGGLEAAGAAADATVVGLPVGVALGVAGAAAALFGLSKAHKGGGAAGPPPASISMSLRAPNAFGMHRPTKSF